MGTEKEILTKTTSEMENNEETALSTLPPKMQRFIHLYVTGQYSIQKLSQLLEVHPNTLSNWLRREDVKAQIYELQQDTHELVGTQLKSLTMEATNRLRDLMNSPIDGVALQAVKDVLDRSGHKAKQEIKVDKTVITYEERLNKLIDDVIDADFVEMDD